MARGPNPDAGKRVVLRRCDVVTTEADDPAQRETEPGWMVVAEVEASSDRAAIEAYAGKPNTPAAKPGTYKSVPLASWKGTATYERPPEPLVGASWSDD